MPALPRDKDATWQTTSAFCDKHGWSRARLLWDLKNKRVLYRIIPPEGDPEGEPEINWHDPLVQESLDVDASQVSTFDEERARAESFRGRGITVVSNGAETFDIEVMLAAEAAPERKPTPKPKPKPKSKPKRTPAPKRPSDTAVEKCLDDIVRDYPNGPLGDEQWLLAEMKDRLGASPGLRDRVRALLRKEKYQSWKRPVGHPRNNISAKNSAA